SAASSRRPRTPRGTPYRWPARPDRPARELLDLVERQHFRIRCHPASCGLPALNAVKELMSDAGRPRADLYEVALLEDMLKVQGNELFYAYMVDNQAIVVPETIDAIRALTRAQGEAAASIAKTDAAMGIGALLQQGDSRETPQRTPKVAPAKAGAPFLFQQNRG